MNTTAIQLEQMNNEYLEENEEILEEYWAENCADGILDDDMPDAFSDWIVDTDFKDLRAIILKATGEEPHHPAFASKEEEDNERMNIEHEMEFTRNYMADNGNNL